MWKELLGWFGPSRGMCARSPERGGGWGTNKKAHRLGVFAQREELFAMSGQAAELWGVRGMLSQRTRCQVSGGGWLWLESGEDPTVAAKSSSSIEAEDWV